MSEKIDQIIEQIKTLTLGEASELVTTIEDTFGVETAIYPGTMVTKAPVEIAAVEEKTEFSVILEKVPADKKIPILKVVRSLTGLGLKEAKTIVETTPQQIQENVTKDTAEEMKKQLENAGATVSLI